MTNSKSPAALADVYLHSCDLRRYDAQKTQVFIMILAVTTRLGEQLLWISQLKNLVGLD